MYASWFITVTVISSYIIIRFITYQFQDFPDISSTIYRRGANDFIIHSLAYIYKTNLQGRGGGGGHGGGGCRWRGGDNVKIFPSLFLAPLNFPHFPSLSILIVGAMKMIWLSFTDLRSVVQLHVPPAGVPGVFPDDEFEGWFSDL